MASERVTQERDRRDDDGCTRPSTKNKIHSKIIDGTNISPKCRKCNQKDETINHIANECPGLAQNQYKKRCNTVARAVHRNLCKKCQKLLLNYSIKTDFTLVDKTNNNVPLIDIAVAWDSRPEQKEQEKKRDKYQDLRIELRRL